MIKDYFPSKALYDYYVELRISKAWVRSNQFLMDMAHDCIKIVDDMLEYFDTVMVKTGTYESREAYLMRVHEIQKLTDYYQTIAKSMWEEVE